jgi:WD40 repeat protein
MYQVPKTLPFLKVLADFMLSTTLILLPYSAYAQEPQNLQLVLQSGHAASVSALAFSPDGKWLASGGDDHLIAIWETASGRVLRKLQAHTGKIGALAFSPDGKLLASGSADGSSILWEPLSGRAIRRFLAPPGNIEHLAFSPDGHLYVAASGYGTAVWELSTGRLLDAIPFEESKGVFPQFLRFTPDGRALLYHTHSELLFRDPSTSKIVRRLQIPENDSRGSVIISPDGRFVAVLNEITNAARIYIQELANGWTVTEFSSKPLASEPPLAFSPDGTILAVAAADKSVHLWDVLAGRELRALPGGAWAASRLAFSPDGHTLAVASAYSARGTITLWNVATGSPRLKLESNVDRAREFLFFQDPAASAPSLMVGTEHGTIQVWDTNTGRPTRTFHEASAAKFQLSPGPDGSALIATSQDKTNTTDFLDATTGATLRTLPFSGFTNWHWTLNSRAGLVAYSTQVEVSKDDYLIRVIDFSTGRERHTFSASLQGNGSLTLTDDKRWLLFSSSATSTAFLWDLTSGKESTLEGEGATLSRDSRFLAIANNGTATLSNLHSGAKFTFPCRPSFSFSSTARYLACGGEGPTTIWDTETGRKLSVLKPRAWATGIYWFSPDERLFFATSTSKPLQVWDIATGTEVLPSLSQSSSEWPRHAFSQDSRWLAITATDGSAQLWRLDSQKLAASIFVLNDGNSWIVTTPSGFFDSSKGADPKDISWNDGVKLWPVERFANLRYRPGLLASVFSEKEP